MAKKRPTPTPEQLANLSPGNRKGGRHKITKRYVETLTDFLVSNHDYFLECLAQLTPKEYVAAHIRMFEDVTPKKIEATVEEMDKPSFIIQLASTIPSEQPQLTSFTEVDEDKKESND
jgi:hypothetical protein